MTTEAVTESNLQETRSFLERHVETSLFLLGGLAKYGPRRGEHPNSGNYQVTSEHGRIVAVSCPTRRGHLLAQTGGRDDLAAEILSAAASDPSPVLGVIAEWAAASSLWARLVTRPNFHATYHARQAVYVYRVDAGDRAPESSRPEIRRLGSADFERWDGLNNAFLAEEQVDGIAVPIEQRRAAFARRIDLGHAWGGFHGDALVSAAVIDEFYGQTAQVGGLFTRPEYRGRGFARGAMQMALSDARERLGFRTMVLFADLDNRQARALYESLGFDASGEFGFFFGSN